VASEQLLNKGFSSWLLNYVFAPIPKSKSVSDIAVVPRIKRVLDEGGNVAIFPEGNMTMHGGPSSMPPAIGKLIKMLKVPVVFVESYGLYFSSPRGSRYRKYGPIGMFIKRILEVEEYASLTGEQINEFVHQQLDVNAFEQRPVRKYRGFRKAEGLQRLVFSCPSCHEPFGMHTHKSTLSCSKCGYRANYDVFGYINGPKGRLDTVTIDGIVKRDYNHYVGAHLDDIVLHRSRRVPLFQLLGKSVDHLNTSKQSVYPIGGWKLTKMKGRRFIYLMKYCPSRCKHAENSSFM
jgi:ribosomal protein S27AE